VRSGKRSDRGCIGIGVCSRRNVGGIEDVSELRCDRLFRWCWGGLWVCRCRVLCREILLELVVARPLCFCYVVVMNVLSLSEIVLQILFLHLPFSFMRVRSRKLATNQ